MTTGDGQLPLRLDPAAGLPPFAQIRAGIVRLALDNAGIRLVLERALVRQGGPETTGPSGGRPR